MELILLFMIPGILGGGIPAAVIFFRTRSGTLTPRTATRMAIVEIVMGAIDLAAGWSSYKVATQPHAAEGGLLTLFFMLVAAAGLTVGPLLVIGGSLQLARVRAAWWFQCAIVGLYALVLCLPIILAF